MGDAGEPVWEASAPIALNFWLFYTSYYLFIIVTFILLLNLLIARMNATYDTIAEISVVKWRLLFARRVIALENGPVTKLVVLGRQLCRCSPALQAGEPDPSRPTTHVWEKEVRIELRSGVAGGSHRGRRVRIDPDFFNIETPIDDGDGPSDSSTASEDDDALEASYRASMRASMRESLRASVPLSREGANLTEPNSPEGSSSLRASPPRGAGPEGVHKLRPNPLEFTSSRLHNFTSSQVEGVHKLRPNHLERASCHMGSTLGLRTTQKSHHSRTTSHRRRASRHQLPNLFKTLPKGRWERRQGDEQGDRTELVWKDDALDGAFPLGFGEAAGWTDGEGGRPRRLVEADAQDDATAAHDQLAALCAYSTPGAAIGTAGAACAAGTACAACERGEAVAAGHPAAAAAVPPAHRRAPTLSATLRGGLANEASAPGEEAAASDGGGELMEAALRRQLAENQDTLKMLETLAKARAREEASQQLMEASQAAAATAAALAADRLVEEHALETSQLAAITEGTSSTEGTAPPPLRPLRSHTPLPPLQIHSVQATPVRPANKATATYPPPRPAVSSAAVPPPWMGERRAATYPPPRPTGAVAPPGSEQLVLVPARAVPVAPSEQVVEVNRGQSYY